MYVRNIHIAIVVIIYLKDVGRQADRKRKRERERDS